MKVVLMTDAEIEDLVKRVAAETVAAFNGGAFDIEVKPGEASVLNIQQAAEFVGLTKQTLYRKTSANEIPHSKQSGRVFFDRKELEAWLLTKRVPTKTELQKQAGEHIADRARRPR